MIRSNYVRASARNQQCTLNIAGVCNYDNSTVVFAHINLPGESGLSQKTDDICGCYACAKCHDLIDGRAKGLKHMSEDWLFYAFRGVARTLRVLHELGILKIGKGDV